MGVTLYQFPSTIAGVTGVHDICNMCHDYYKRLLNSCIIPDSKAVLQQKLSSSFDIIDFFTVTDVSNVKHFGEALLVSCSEIKLLL